MPYMPHSAAFAIGHAFTPSDECYLFISADAIAQRYRRRSKGAAD